jgi:hypothetical protein
MYAFIGSPYWQKASPVVAAPVVADVLLRRLRRVAIDT